MKKVLVIGHDMHYYRPFYRFGELSGDLSLLENDPDQISLVVLTGGEDINPVMYGEVALPTTYFNYRRDRFEVLVAQFCLENHLPMVGICRGAQFLCVLADGKLVQHVNGHGRPHAMRTNDGRLMGVTSTHHQMQVPPEDAMVLAWAEPKMSNCYLGVETPPEKEFECVYYPSVRGLGIQFHAECMPKESSGFKYCTELVKTHLNIPEAIDNIDVSEEPEELEE